MRKKNEALKLLVVSLAIVAVLITIALVVIIKTVEVLQQILEGC